MKKPTDTQIKITLKNDCELSILTPIEITAEFPNIKLTIKNTDIITNMIKSIKDDIKSIEVVKISEGY